MILHGHYEELNTFQISIIFRWIFAQKSGGYLLLHGGTAGRTHQYVLKEITEYAALPAGKRKRFAYVVKT